MSIWDILKTAAANTFRSKLRTTLTILAIFMGAFTLTITNGLGTGISNYIDTQVASIGASDTFTVTKTIPSQGANSGPQKYDPNAVAIAGGGPSRLSGETTLALKQSDLTAIGAVSGISRVDPAIRVTPDYVQLAGHDKYVLSIDNIVSSKPTLAAGSKLDQSASAFQLLLPAAYVSPMGFASSTDAVGKTISFAITDAVGAHHLIPATIVGIQNATLIGGGGAAINTALKTALHNAQIQGAPVGSTNIWASAMATFSTNATTNQISSMKTALKNAGYTATTIDDQIGSFRAVINGIIGVLNAFAVIALIAAGFGIINTLLMSVQERTREIGLMKAMGMSSAKVFGLFSFEAVFIGFLGSAIGSAIGILLGSGISSFLAGSVLKALAGLRILTFAPLSIAGVILLVMAIAFAAGTLPASRAARQNPIESLRYE